VGARALRSVHKKHPKKENEKKKEQKRLALSVNDEDRKRERESVCVCVSRLELHFRKLFRCGTDLVSSLKQRERESRECTKREKKKKKNSMLRCDL
jgi:hypothetical protein